MPYKAKTRLSARNRGFASFLGCCVLLGGSTAVFAQDSQQAESLVETKTTQPSEGLAFNLPSTTDFSSQSGQQFDLPLEAVGSTMFKLDMTTLGCASGSETCVRREERLKLGVSDTFRRHSKKGLDLSLTPRASMKFNDAVSSTAVGAVIEIGEDLREGSNIKSNTWYVFAGADAEALSYSPNSVDRITAGEFHLQDRIIVGDAQAGLGYRIGDADVSLSYMRREASNEEFTYKEDAAALSITWKR